MTLEQFNSIVAEKGSVFALGNHDSVVVEISFASGRPTSTPECISSLNRGSVVCDSCVWDYYPKGLYSRYDCPLTEESVILEMSGCSDTGCGSVEAYSAADLFATQAEAQKELDILAAVEHFRTIAYDERIRPVMHAIALEAEEYERKLRGVN